MGMVDAVHTCGRRNAAPWLAYEPVVARRKGAAPLVKLWKLNTGALLLPDRWRKELRVTHPAG